jgi:flagellar FliL protein
VATQAAKASAATSAPADNKKAGDKPAGKAAAGKVDTGKADPAKAKEAGAAAPAARKLKISKKMLIMVLAVVILLAGIGAGAWFFFGRHPKDAVPEEAAKPAAAKAAAKQTEKKDDKKADAKKDEKKKIVEYMSGDPYYTVNLTDEDNDRFLQLGVVFEISDPKASEQLKERMPAVRSNILFLLSSKHSQELMTVEGKKKLAEELLGIARQALDVAPPDNGVQAVDFSVFVIQ